MRRPQILILCAALIATLPLIFNGCSCGHDFTFHLQSWLDAAEQFRHGTLLPQWAFSPAYNAGEPRFIFYPPISWMLGALLTLIFPIAVVPAIYTFIALSTAGLAMHRLARHFAPPNAALLASVIYAVNPYMLFTAYERTAYAELLAAAWLPLLFLAVLRKRPTIPGIAFPLALLWLTNAPAAVMGSYTLALIVIIRIVAGMTRRTGAPDPDFRTRVFEEPLKLTLTSSAGTVLGLALPAFYLIPAAYERRFVQIAMAIIPNMRFKDNFLFGHTGDAPHDAVLHTASLIAVILLMFIASALIDIYFRARKKTIAEQPSGHWAVGPELLLAILTITIAFLLTPLSSMLWNHVPELAFLQFPWRLLSILAAVFALALAKVVRAPKPTASVVCAVIFTLVGIHAFRQGCDDTDLPSARLEMFRTHQGVEPTDEYTPTTADNDALHTNDPAYWLSTNPAAFAPGTAPNPAATDPNYTGPPADTHSAEVPHHFTVHINPSEILILNLRNYPSWDVTVDDPNSLNRLHLPQIPRGDGLIAIRPYHEGDYRVNIAWHRTLDQQLGLALSAIGLCIYVVLAFIQRSRRIED
jgi:hypothetical protein